MVLFLLCKGGRSRLYNIRENMNTNQLYDKYKRDKKAKTFYNSTAWLRCRKLALIRDNYLCQKCLKENKITTADMVHHIRSLEDYPELALVLENLESLCNACHNMEHPEKGGGKKKEISKVRVLVVKANKEII